MYTIKNDAVLKVKSAPSPAVGAPLPVILADEGSLWLAYYVDENDPSYQESSDELSKEECFAVVLIERAHVHIFGAPGEQTFEGHPLSNRGLTPCMIAEIQCSSWIDALEKVDALDSYPGRVGITGLRHFVFSFHDSTLECVANNFKVFVRHGNMIEEILKVKQDLVDGKPANSELR